MSERMEQVGKRLLRQLTTQGYEAFWVGGCVRDKLLGRPLKDIDIATSATPDDVMRLFPHSIPTGLQHGTVTVVEERIPYEVTTFRRETDYADHRRPKSVEYVSELQEDLNRRDFTINAIAMDADGSIVDPFGGRDDLKRGVLRCVGEAKERFEEDALRMLRCIRFACEYGLQIEAATWQALLEHAPLLRYIAMERVQAELDKIIGGAGPDLGIRLLGESRLLQHTKEALPWPAAMADGDEPEPGGPSELWPGPLNVLEGADLRWAYWLLQQGVGTEEAREGFSRLRFSSDKTSTITALLRVEAWMAPQLAEAPAAADAPLREALARAAVRYGADAVRGWLRLLAPGAAAPPRAGRAPRDARRHRLHQSGTDWLQAVPATRVGELALGGRDVLAALGRPGGPWLGRLLDDLLLAVALGRLPNERERLLEAARQQIERDAHDE
ncbi:CCA tRNA nucleotidyltransferase [Paenibacillus sp. HJGM_3]|uniref:CCA tRNA nucleotidyltransferase n=1 Tax=Paenibacillus sp. HJGM_3 TaxID=3379816 RepID=UPI00385EC12E